MVPYLKKTFLVTLQQRLYYLLQVPSYIFKRLSRDFYKWIHPEALSYYYVILNQHRLLFVCQEPRKFHFNHFNLTPSLIQFTKSTLLVVMVLHQDFRPHFCTASLACGSVVFTK